MIEKQKQRLDKILKGIEKAANQFNVEPCDVTKTQFFQSVEDVTPWDLRELGGLSNIKRAYFPNQTKDLAVIRKEKEIVKYINKLEQKASGNLVLEEEFQKIIKDSLKNIKIEKINIKTPKTVSKNKMTIELMISDVHYGKKTKTFDYKICRTRMQKLTQVFLQELARKKKEGYDVERVIIAILGDLLESFSMHGLESAMGCEFGNSAQVQSAITSLYYDVILPIAKTGIKIDIPCVTGNHDRTETYRTMNEPGLNNLTWIIYNSLQEYCKLAGLTNVSFEITRGSHIIGNIYGNNILWEHGDNLKSNSKRSFETLIDNRARQNNVTIEFGRFGHWHEYVVHDRGRIIVNESVCGQDSYAEIKGFDSKVGQTINFYVKTNNRPNCFYMSFPVDLSSK